MPKFIRTTVVLLSLAAAAYYVWQAATVGPGDERWFGPHAAAPAMALPLLCMGFAFTSETTITAFTGKNTGPFRHAPVGIGTVVSVAPTGLEVNDRPEVRLELDVHGAEGERFRSRAKTLLGPADLAAIRPGQELPVRYIPGRTDKVELDRSGDPALARAAMERALVSSGRATPEAIEIRRRGVPAQGVVRALQVSGELRGKQVGFILDITVTRPDGTTFDVRKQPFLPGSAAPYVQVGCVLDVHYLAHDESTSVVSVPA